MLKPSSTLSHRMHCGVIVILGTLCLRSKVDAYSIRNYRLQQRRGSQCGVPPPCPPRFLLPSADAHLLTDITRALYLLVPPCRKRLQPSGDLRSHFEHDNPHLSLDPVLSHHWPPFVDCSWNFLNLSLVTRLEPNTTLDLPPSPKPSRRGNGATVALAT